MLHPSASITRPSTGALPHPCFIIAGCATADEVRKSVDEEYLLFWQIDYNICMYQVHEASTDEEPEDPDEEEEVASFHAMRLPNVELEGVWESLHFSEDGIKDRLVRYASSALHFSDKGVNTKLVSWNRSDLLSQQLAWPRTIS